jgi:hypothetical protein
MKLLSAIVVLLLAGAVSAAGPVAGTGWRLRMDGFGPVKPGMTPMQIKKVIGVRILEDTDSPTEGCWYLRALDELDGVSFMIIDGRVALIEIDSPKFLTVSGAGIDRTEEQLKKLYGPLPSAKSPSTPLFRADNLHPFFAKISSDPSTRW